MRTLYRDQEIREDLFDRVLYEGTQKRKRYPCPHFRFAKSQISLLSEMRSDLDSRLLACYHDIQLFETCTCEANDIAEPQHLAAC